MPKNNNKNHSNNNNVRKNVFLKGLSFLGSKLGAFVEYLNVKLSSTRRSLIIIAVISFVMNILLELSLRHSFGNLFTLILTSPHVFILGVLILFATLCSMFIFKRRSFVFVLVNVLWVIVTIVNFFLMVVCHRSTPFQSSDLRIFNTAFEIIQKGYLEIYQMVLIAIGVLILVSFLIFVFIKSKKEAGLFDYPAFISILLCSITLVSTIFYTNKVVALDKYDNPPNMFRKHGYVFCFLYSILDSGIDKPYGYSIQHFDETRKVVNKRFAEENSEIEEPFYVNQSEADAKFVDEVFNMVVDEYALLPEYPYYEYSEKEANAAIEHLTENRDALKEKYGDEAVLVSGISDSQATLKKPNIIFLQLESFCDVENIESFTYSPAPHPIYSKMKQELPGGRLTVPSVGAGTANVEFEVMTGMNRSHFGFGEYPFLSVLQTQTCESMAYNAKDYGYKAHVIHNNSSTFYDRNRVFPNLGFDSFIAIESIENTRDNPQKWCKDISLLEPIIKTLKSTKGQDLIYTISVQPHGQYPDADAYAELLDGNKEKIKVSGFPGYPELPGFKYYVNQLNEVDTFIGHLLVELNNLNEPTILIVYGDHLPAFSVQDYWRLEEGNYFQTDYMIWNNCGIEFETNKDLTTYQLCSYVFGKVGINSGDLNKLNRIYLNDKVESYNDYLAEYQNAIFYDEAAKDPTCPIIIKEYTPSNMTFGYPRK